MEICTIGFTKHTAESFFGLLRDEGVGRLIDVRLNNTGQLSGFAKRDDLKYFLDHLCHAEYIHEPDLLAPTEELLKEYKKKDLSWDDYETRFVELMAHRKIEEKLTPDIFDLRTVLLCSEHSPDHCHRRLVVEYLSQHWGNVTPIHLPRTCSVTA